MVSTNGNGPRMAAIVRRFISKKLPKNTGQAIIKVGQLRKKLRRIAPDIEEGPKRMKWYGLYFRILILERRMLTPIRMSDVCEAWTLEDLCDMTDDDMEQLLTHYEPNDVPSLQALRSLENGGTFGFDGSFGWWI
jgi:precorrin-2 dehydrogenase/sirohydrochlorin ferrochelatase